VGNRLVSVTKHRALGKVDVGDECSQCEAAIFGDVSHAFDSFDVHESFWGNFATLKLDHHIGASSKHLGLVAKFC
jgi:hypothetical protein